MDMRKSIRLAQNNFLFYLSRKMDFPFIAPEVIQISLTLRCNLKCRMCTLSNSLPLIEELSREQIFRIIDEAQKFGIKEVLLTGGEPFLREDLFDICEYIDRKGLRTIVTTNGTAINKTSIEAIGQKGIHHIHISLDGLQETHDFFRGRGSFGKTIETIHALDQARKNGRFFSLGIACTVMDSNVKELSKIVEFADDLGIDVINFQPLSGDNANFKGKNSSAFWVRTENIPVLKREIEKIRAYRSRHIKILKEPRPELLIKYYEGKLTLKDWVCFGGFKTLFICYSKKEPLVYSCHGICGNLDKISLRQAWRSKDAAGLRRHSRQCKNLCLQSCYSKEAAQTLSRLSRCLVSSES